LETLDLQTPQSERAVAAQSVSVASQSDATSVPSSACSDYDIDEYDWTILSESSSISEGGYETDVSCDYEDEELFEEESVSGDDAVSFISQGGYYSDRSDVLTEAEDEEEGVTYAPDGGDGDDEPDWGPEVPVLDATVRVSAWQRSPSFFESG
jgi:hypothetical protein